MPSLIARRARSRGSKVGSTGFVSVVVATVVEGWGWGWEVVVVVVVVVLA